MLALVGLSLEPSLVFCIGAGLDDGIPGLFIGNRVREVSIGMD